MLREWGRLRPSLGKGVYVAESAEVIGGVVLGDGSSVWPGAVLRADLDAIVVGRRTNIQDGVIMHTNTSMPVRLGDDVSVAHGAILHGCTVGSGSLIGIGAVLMDGVEIGVGAIVAAGSFLRENTIVPPRTLAAGNPAKAARPLTVQDEMMARSVCAEYRRLAENYTLKPDEPDCGAT